MHADQRDPIGGGGGRQYLKQLLVAVTGERGDDHGVETGIGGLTGAGMPTLYGRHYPV
jgi:hypothetical protein